MERKKYNKEVIQLGVFMKIVNYGKKSTRRNYSRVRTSVDLPDLIEIQTKSFDWFVEQGLKEVFEDASPITSFNGDLKLSFLDYRFEDPKYNVVESKLRKINYSRPLKVKVLLEHTQTGDLFEHEMFMGDIPYMTPVGTFVINGAERVVISQIIRSSGVYFDKEIDKKTGDIKFSGQVIPTRGAWIEYEAGSKDVWYGKLDRSKKIPLTTVLRAYGLSTDEQIIDLFGNSEHLTATFEKEKEENKNSENAAIEVYSKLRQGDRVPADGARALISDRLFNANKYDLQTVGRFKYNIKLDVLQRAKNHTLAQDVVAPKDIFDEAKKGDTLALEAVEILGETLGMALSNIACVVNPQVFVIGGGVSKAGDILIDTVVKHFKEHAFASCKDTKFALASLGNDAGMYGCVQMILD